MGTMIPVSGFAQMVCSRVLTPEEAPLLR
jgi:hypothetical protein